MTYVIAEPCIGTKDASCIAVCPVDCIHPLPTEPGYEGTTQMYIDPEECIDCAACEPACPVEAIFRDDDLPEQWASYAKVNADHFAGG
jgi:ferredoxin